MDASTAILLAKVELLDDFLREAGRPVVMPKDVQTECCVRETFDAKLIARAIKEKRISVKPIPRRGLAAKVKADFTLSLGEAAAIALAAGREGALVATDDKRAINACKLMKIPFTTAISVLVRMREKGIVGRHEAVAKLNALAGFGRYKKETVAAALAQLEG